MFEVVAPRLFNAQVSVETGVTRRTRQRLIVLEADVAARARILVSLRQPKVNNVNDMLLLLDANEEIVGFDIAMQEAVLMNKLDPLQHLNGQHEHGF